MGRLEEIIQNANAYLLLFCVTYSFVCGCLFPEISDKLYNRKRNSRLAITQLIRSLGSWVIILVISCLPGKVSAMMTDNNDYGGSSLLFFLIGWCTRRFLHEAKIWRGPPWF